jgi:hypothetical protein
MNLIAHPTQESRNGRSVEPHVRIAEMMILPVNRY